MKKFLIALTAVLFAMLPASAQSTKNSAADNIIGKYESVQGGDAYKVEVTKNADGTYKVSMRTNGAVDVAAICVKHGGGGHVRAAGVTMTGDPEVILQTLLDDVKEQL